MRIPERLSMWTHKHNKRRVGALTVLSGCLLLAPATWAQANTTDVTQQANPFLAKLKARMQGGSRFDRTHDVAVSDPTVQSAAPAESSVLPQFAFGGGWYSALYFTNLTGAAVSFPVSFVGDAGTPLTVPSLGGSTTQVKLAAYGTAIIEAPNVGGLVQGYAAFTLPNGVFGYGVFRGQGDQEAVVPLSDAGASSNTLTWDETNLVTAVAIVNPSSTAATVGVTLWDENGNTIGTSSVALPPNGKTAAALRSLPGLGGMLGKRGSAQFKVSTGSVDVLGLRFGPGAFTSIPTTGTSANVLAERALAQTGLGIGLASTVLQSQFAMAMQVLTQNVSCTALPGGGSVRWTGSGIEATYFGYCTHPYVVTSPDTTITGGNNQLAVSETATYYGLDGTIIGTLSLNRSEEHTSELQSL